MGMHIYLSSMLFACRWDLFQFDTTNSSRLAGRCLRYTLGQVFPRVPCPEEPCHPACHPSTYTTHKFIQ